MLALHCYQSDYSRAAKIGTHAETQRRREDSLCASASVREIKNRSLILARLRLGRPECSLQRSLACAACSLQRSLACAACSLSGSSATASTNTSFSVIEST